MKLKILVNFKAGRPNRLGGNPFWKIGQVVEGPELERLLESKDLEFLEKNKFVEVLPEEEKGDDDPSLLAGDESKDGEEGKDFPPPASYDADGVDHAPAPKEEKPKKGPKSGKR